METTTSTEPRFAKVVRQKLIDNKLAGRKPDSIRGLSRAMARGDASLADTHKRSLFKWMAIDGPKPLPTSRALVAHALGNCEPEELQDDDSEADPAMRQAFSLFVDLMHVIGTTKSNAPTASLASSAAGASTTGG